MMKDPGTVRFFLSVAFRLEVASID
uniref:Uncharacterized protein n=1 Tax=Arundo donax TaxID=35708 RepID=A0A0A8XSA7_ARUDO